MTPLGTTAPPPLALGRRSLLRDWRARPHRALAALVTLLVALAAWATLAPPVFGGSTSYAITDGISMLPHFHAGDLVILRRERDYHVGEVAAYHNLQLKEVVMHRIVAVHGGHYVFKGDNNGWVDGFEPNKSQIVGAELLQIPGAGRFVEKLRNPVAAAVLLGILWLASFSPRHRSRRQRRRHRYGH
jgi:signal peptidase I